MGQGSTSSEAMFFTYQLFQESAEFDRLWFEEFGVPFESDFDALSSMDDSEFDSFMSNGKND